MNFGASNVLRLISNLILTRLLFPEAFGIMAIVLVVIGAIQMFSDVGFQPSIIQNERGDDPAFLDTAWVMQIGRGMILWLVAWALAEPMSAFYGEPMLADLLPVVALTAMIKGFESTKLLTASRHLMLGRVTMMGLGIQIFTTTVMAILAYLTGSVWALVWGMIASAMVRTILSHTILPGHSNRFRFERQAFNELFGFGKFIILSSIAGFFLAQGDRAILGKFATLTELAVYNIGFFLASVPLILAKALGRSIVFPLYSNRPPSKSEENRRKINHGRILMTGFAFSGILVLAVIGDWLVRFLYDPRYYDAGPLLILVVLCMIPSLIMQSYQALFLAAGHSGRFAIFMSLRAAVRLGSMVVGAATMGAPGVPLAIAVSELITYPVLVAMIRPYKGWDLRHDVLFAAVGFGVVFVALTINGDLLTPLLARFDIAGLSQIWE